jgi:hypothetical protein
MRKNNSEGPVEAHQVCALHRREMLRDELNQFPNAYR